MQMRTIQMIIHTSLHRFGTHCILKKYTLPSPLKKLFHFAAEAENKRRLGQKGENTKLEVKKIKALDNSHNFQCSRKI